VVEFEGEVITLSAQLDKDAARIESDLTQHNIDIKAFNERVELGQDDINKKLERRATFVQTVGGVGQALISGQLTPQAGIAAVIQLVTLFGVVGLGYDNRRKDKRIVAGKTPASEKT